MNGKAWLKIAAGWSFFMAACQAVISLSPALAAYFMAPPSLVLNRWRLLLWGEAAAVVLVIFGLYALSGAAVIRRLPLMRLGLLGISVLLTLRGLFIVLEILTRLLVPYAEPPLQGTVSSLVFLAAGLSFAIGTILRWKDLRPGR